MSIENAGQLLEQGWKCCITRRDADESTAFQDRDREALREGRTSDL
jgi:hypothetical protein